MLPVVRGEHTTAVQIVLYAFLTVIVSLLPVVAGGLSIGALAVLTVLNAGLLVMSFGLLRTTSRPKARALFKYSMVYLAVFFLCLAVDKTW
jgi:protoheme IX farnesyltransferase